MAANNTDLGHGDTVAAWATVIILMVSSVVLTAGVWFASSVAIIAGTVMIPAALAVGFFLKKSGYGKGGSKTKSAH
ncbi:MAG: hypothetical protein KA500_02795 [Rhodoluna sp.]|nr:hypothetical protein [Rhodoluna sp.]MBP6186776.1 hypothetical protein [Rhodoluna sp.]